MKLALICPLLMLLVSFTSGYDKMATDQGDDFGPALTHLGSSFDFGTQDPSMTKAKGVEKDNERLASYGYIRLKETTDCTDDRDQKILMEFAERTLVTYGYMTQEEADRARYTYTGSRRKLSTEKSKAEGQHVDDSVNRSRGLSSCSVNFCTMYPAACVYMGEFKTRQAIWNGPGAVFG